MPELPQLALFISAMIFVGFMFRCHKHLHLPKTLLSSGTLLLVGQFWNLAQTVLGADRLVREQLSQQHPMMPS